MPATVSETGVGRRATNVHAERQYIIRSAADEATALTAVQGYAPSTIGGLLRQDNDIELDELKEGDIWLARVPWTQINRPQNQPPSSFHISFDISGTTQHITQSISTVAKYPSTTARDFKGAIGVNQDGTIEGCDIQIPALTYQINFTFPNSSITDAYIQTLMGVVGKVNSDTFHNFSPGTQLLTKVAGQKREDTNWDLSFGFACSENVTGLTVGTITGINKKGWEYLWVYYTEEADTTTDGVKYIRKIPTNVYIEQVYKTTAYSALGI